MVNISYRMKGSDCVTKCPFGQDRMVGSYACKGCKSHFQQLEGLRQVICKGV